MGATQTRPTRGHRRSKKQPAPAPTIPTAIIPAHVPRQVGPTKFDRLVPGHYRTHRDRVGLGDLLLRRDRYGNYPRMVVIDRIARTLIGLELTAAGARISAVSDLVAADPWTWDVYAWGPGPDPVGFTYQATVARDVFARLVGYCQPRSIWERIRGQRRTAPTITTSRCRQIARAIAAGPNAPGAADRPTRADVAGLTTAAAKRFADIAAGVEPCPAGFPVAETTPADLASGPFYHYRFTLYLEA